MSDASNGRIYCSSASFSCLAIETGITDVSIIQNKSNIIVLQLKPICFVITIENSC